MPNSEARFTVALAQAGPAPFDGERSTALAVTLIREAGARGARLVLLPEAFIPGYPRGEGFGTVVGNRSIDGRILWRRYWENAVDVPGPITDTLGEAARRAGLIAAVGVVERDLVHTPGTLYCTLLYFGSDGRLLGKHRKLKPTGAERLIWGEGDGSTLTVLPTEIGRIGGLICWENYMPLARMAIYAKGVEIYLAPTADARDTWQATLRHIACEGRCFVLAANQFLSRDMYSRARDPVPAPAGQPEILCRGGSAIVGPLGDLLAGPLFDREAMLFAEIDLAEIVQARMDFDAVGHYARPDIFRLLVDESPRPAVDFGGQGNMESEPRGSS